MAILSVQTHVGNIGILNYSFFFFSSSILDLYVLQPSSGDIISFPTPLPFSKWSCFNHIYHD